MNCKKVLKQVLANSPHPSSFPPAYFSKNKLSPVRRSRSKPASIPLARTSLRNSGLERPSLHSRH
jgi:hypothetical protein